MSTADTETRRIPKYAIEADHHRNCDLLIQVIPGCRLRSALLPTRTVKDNKTGKEMTPLDQVRGLSMFPTVPGMQLIVFPEDLKYKIVDPLHDDDDLCQQIAAARHQLDGFRGEVRGVETTTGALDIHEMKTLVREMFNIVQNGDAKAILGSPNITMEDIDGLEGHYLLNPGSRVHNSQPRYEKDFDSWVAQLGRTGG